VPTCSRCTTNGRLALLAVLDVLVMHDVLLVDAHSVPVRSTSARFPVRVTWPTPRRWLLPGADFGQTAETRSKAATLSGDMKVRAAVVLWVATSSVYWIAVLSGPAAEVDDVAVALATAGMCAARLAHPERETPLTTSQIGAVRRALVMGPGRLMAETYPWTRHHTPFTHSS
jgi:hypothetical protein